MPVPRLPLEVVLTAKDGSTPRPLTCGSDRSCVTRANPTNTLPDTPGEGTMPRSAMALPLPPLQIRATITPRSVGGGEDPQNTEPWSPQSLTGFFTPRSDLSLDKLTLASPRSGSLRTPLGSPLMSPHSPTCQQSMMSPMRMVGTRSPCSIKLSGGSSTRLNGGGGVNHMRTSGGTPFTSPRGGNTTTTTNNNDNMNSGMRPVRKQSVSRALPFTQPTPAAEISARQTMERFQLPHFNGRELSFSDLLDPSAKDRVHRMHHSAGTTMPLSFVNGAATAAGGGGVSSPSQIRQPTPILTGFNNRGGIPTSPVKIAQAQPQAQAPQAVVDFNNNNNDGQATPRKRPRKNTAPQRADFGNDDTCGGSAGGGGGSSGINDSSHGETSAMNTRSGNNNNNNNNNNAAAHHAAAVNNNNGFGSMTWEKEDGGAHTSPLKKNIHHSHPATGATSNRTKRTTTINNNDMNNGAAGSSDLSVDADGDGGVQRRALHKRDHQ